MMFIDGSWLYASTPKLAESYGKPDYHVDFGRLPSVLADQIRKQPGVGELDFVRTYLFGSYPSNCDPADHEVAERQLKFFNMLKEEFHYEVEVFPINFMGKRLRKSDRVATDTFEPKEKAVDVSLATTMAILAALPGAYDIAIAVVGDRDFVPALQQIRRLGKRVAIASIKRCCSAELADPIDQERVKDYDVFWLDDLVIELELKYERHRIPCESPTHVGERLVLTEYHPRKSEKFYCDACRKEFVRQKHDAQREYVATHVKSTPAGETVEPASLGQELSGVIKRKLPERGYGFIGAADGEDYYFHFSDLASTLEFETMPEGFPVQFQVKRLPGDGKAGAAQDVRPQNNWVTAAGWPGSSGAIPRNGC
jgi:cold shock CspA family protein